MARWLRPALALRSDNEYLWYRVKSFDSLTYLWYRVKSVDSQVYLWYRMRSSGSQTYLWYRVSSELPPSGGVCLCPAVEPLLGQLVGPGGLLLLQPLSPGLASLQRLLPHLQTTTHGQCSQDSIFMRHKYIGRASVLRAHTYHNT